MTTKDRSLQTQPGIQYKQANNVSCIQSTPRGMSSNRAGRGGGGHQPSTQRTGPEMAAASAGETRAIRRERHCPHLPIRRCTDDDAYWGESNDNEIERNSDRPHSAAQTKSTPHCNTRKRQRGRQTIQATDDPPKKTRSGQSFKKRSRGYRFGRGALPVAGRRRVWRGSARRHPA